MSLSTRLPWELARERWASEINPVLAFPMLSGIQINSIILEAMIPKAINHLLGRIPMGWFVVDNNASSVIWRTEPFTTKTITLESDDDTTISLFIY